MFVFFVGCANRAPETLNSGTPECGNNICELNENSISCSEDCQSGAVCGNNFCDIGETVQLCPTDCQPVTTCGNNICESTETSTSCSVDCRTAVCGNLVCDAGETFATCPSDCSNPTPPSCTITFAGGSPVVSTPASNVSYLISLAPSTAVSAAPTISTTPASALQVTSVTPASGSGTTSNSWSVSGSFVAAGTIEVKASTTVSGTAINCQVTTVVTTAVIPTALVYRFDRANPPDILYQLSPTPPAGYTVSWIGSTPIPMFKVYTQPPPASKCTSIPLNQCKLQRSSTLQSSFLTQVECSPTYINVSRLGYSCFNPVSGTVKLQRLTNNIDGRFYSTAAESEIPGLELQGWINQGVIGYVPLQ